MVYWRIDSLAHINITGGITAIAVRHDGLISQGQEREFRQGSESKWRKVGD